MSHFLDKAHRAAAARELIERGGTFRIGPRVALAVVVCVVVGIFLAGLELAIGGGQSPKTMTLASVTLATFVLLGLVLVGYQRVAGLYVSPSEIGCINAFGSKTTRCLRHEVLCIVLKQGSGAQSGFDEGIGYDSDSLWIVCDSASNPTCRLRLTWWTRDDARTLGSIAEVPLYESFVSALEHDSRIRVLLTREDSGARPV